MLTRDRFLEDSPAWSYDRKRIAFTRYEPRAERCHATCSGSIWTMDANGGSRRRVTHPPDRVDNWFDEGESWSPDGKWLVFERYNPGGGSIYTVASDGSHLRRIVTGGAVDPLPSDPAWGPDGRIALVSDRDGGGIFLVNGDGSGWRKLVKPPGRAGYGSNVASPAWDASGSRIAFAQAERGRIYIASAVTGAIERVIRIPINYHLGKIAWSPDSRTLAFDAFDRIYLVDTDGHNLRPLTGPNAPVSGLVRPRWPAWR
jgi:Tol biopolymer transport system component